MTHSNQISGVKRGTAQVRHNRPSKGVLKFPLPKDIPKVWFQIFLPKKSDTWLFITTYLPLLHGLGLLTLYVLNYVFNHVVLGPLSNVIYLTHPPESIPFG